MKHNHLKEAVLLGLAMEMAACTTGMAKDITGQITDTSHNGTYSDNVTITNGNSNYAAIQIGHEEDGKPKPDYTANVNISTTKNHNITIDSEGYGIRTENASTGTIYLKSGNNNEIQFASGSGISNNANGTSHDASGETIKGVNIKLEATNGTNSITYDGEILENKDNNDHDGINVGDSNTGNIELIGAANTIDVKGSGSDGIYTDTGSNSNVTLTAEAENNTIIAGNNGIDHRGSGKVTLTATEANDITAGTGGDGARIEGNGTIIITGKSNSIHAEDDGLNIANNYSGSIEVHSTVADNEIHGDNRGIHAVGGKVTVTADTGKNFVSGYRGIWAENGTVKIDAEIENNEIKGEEVGIYDDGGTVTLTGTSNSISGATGVNVEADGFVEMQAAAGTNVIQGGKNKDNNGIYDKGGTVSLNGYKNEVSGGTGIQVESGKVSLEATGNNEVTGHANYGITAQAGTVDLISKATNIVSGGNFITSSVETRNAASETFGAGYAVHASGELGQEQTKVTFSAADQNQFLGAVYASGNASVEMGFDQYIGGGSMGNYVASSAVIGKSEASEGEDIVSALYAGNGASITVKGMENTILSSAASVEKSGSGAVERTIWASKGGSIEIDGKSIIAASQAGKDNVIGIAMAAGTGDLSDEIIHSGEIPDVEIKDRSTITLNYGAGSQITGDVVSGYGGNIVISSTSQSTDGITKDTGRDLSFTGNALASNGGQMTIDLGNNGYWEGRADSYKDADNDEWRDAHTEQFAPEFSKGIYSSGNITVDMGTNSYWNVTGQSWVNSLEGNGTIDLRGKDTGGYAIHIGNITGEHTFIVDLDTTGSSGDMIYIWKGTNDTQTLKIANQKDVLESLAPGERVRFATIGNAGGGFTSEGMDTEGPSLEGDTVSTFGTMTQIRDAGIYNVDFHIEYDPYGKDGATESEDERYNELETESKSREESSQLGEAKPGNEYINDIYSKGDNPYNVYIVREDANKLSSAGKTVLDMSKVNYSNAVYMDRLNKRMGEARYIEGDDGLWVRLRHDRIGRADAFRSMNTMFELGYDRKVQDQKDGEHRRGVAFDYMRGEANYTNVMGSGDVRRAGVWLYDTWLGDKGHYSDYVLKYGRLSNDFDIFSESGDKISGDYDNDVWSASAEYGRKKDIGNEWYFEPQAQLQYAYVTSADYTTSQGSKVELDGIDSLIGRAGFRLGRDTSEGNTVYFKADILHEFLGDQSIRAIDSTGVLSTTYDNEGTWYDVGFGFSHRMGEDSYMFLDVEHSFGNDNEDTYQINIGLNRAF